MKVALLSCLYPYRGWIAQFNASLLTELGKSHEVKAFNFTRQYPDMLFPGKTQKVTPDDEAIPVESEAVLDSVNPFSWIKTARRIREWGPDILILRYWMSFFAPCLGYVARHMAPGCKVIAILDNVIPHEPHFFDAPLTKYFLKGVDGCVTLCKEVGQDLAALNPDKPRTVIPHPIYSHFGAKMERGEAEKVLGIRPGMKNLLFFGLIREYKGLDILLEAFDRLSQDYQLVIAGEPYGSFDKYRELIDKSPGKERIHVFNEYIKDSEVSKFFSASDLVVLPYRSATQSGIRGICCHFEIPMVVTDVGGLKETIGDAGIGLVSPDCTPEGIATMVRKFFADPSVRESCSASFRREKEEHSWKKFAEDIVSFSDTLQA